MASIIA